jgi:hypothetical protein
MFKEICKQVREDKEIQEHVKNIKEAIQEIKCIWAVEMHQLKINKIARQAKRDIAKLKRNPYIGD